VSCACLSGSFMGIVIARPERQSAQSYRDHVASLLQPSAMVTPHHHPK
jgi:hypothetical protein